MLTVKQANDVNTVLRYMLGLRPSWGDAPTREDAKAAATRLADSSYKRLSAGLNGSRVSEAFDRLDGVEH